jgi:transposase
MSSVILSAWDRFLVEKRKLEQALRAQAETDPDDMVWQSLPGIAALSGRILCNELGDMSQFPNERALFSFTGLTPGEYSSGEKIYRGHISRQGSSRLRHVLVEAAWRSIREDHVLREDFERIAARCGKKRAIVAIARELVGRARAVFRSKEAYELGYRKAA